MKILIAKTAGFCMGVRRAVEMALDAPAKHQGPFFTFGPLIHNPQVLKLLEEKGVRTLETIPAAGSGTVLIRAHGVPPQTRTLLETAGFTVIDATCPRVIRVQTIIAKHAAKGYAVIIVGDADHPEVVGLMGHARGKGHVVADLAALADLPEFEKAIVVAQTTQDQNLFDQVRQWVEHHRPHYRIADTICDSTAKRQAEVASLTEAVDALIVAGGKSSGNTQRLAAIARRRGKPVFSVESESELDLAALSSLEHIGITAGASTPNWIIKEIYRRLETLPLTRASRWGKVLFNLQRVLLLTNIYVALGAGSLCYALSLLMGIAPRTSHVLVAMVYVLSMHVLNNLTGTMSDRYNDPERAVFYQNHKVFLSVLAVSVGGIGLLTAFTLGLGSFGLLLAMSLMGLSYNLRLLPRFIAKGRIRRIRDIPGSKTILIAMAWGIVTAVFPALSTPDTGALKTAIGFGLASLWVFCRTAFFDILDVQGDRLVGKGTIPIMIGEKKTYRLLNAGLTLLAATMAALSLAGFFTGAGLVLAVCPLVMWVIFSTHQRGRMHPGMRTEFLVETQFLLSGLLALVWSALSAIE